MHAASSSSPPTAQLTPESIADHCPEILGAERATAGIVLENSLIIPTPLAKKHSLEEVLREGTMDLGSWIRRHQQALTKMIRVQADIGIVIPQS
jgi:hypothetical protein